MDTDSKKNQDQQKNPDLSGSETLDKINNF